MPDDYLWLGPPWPNLSFSLALTIYESFAIFSFLCDDALHKLGNIHASLTNFVYTKCKIWYEDKAPVRYLISSGFYFCLF